MWRQSGSRVQPAAHRALWYFCNAYDNVSEIFWDVSDRLLKNSFYGITPPPHHHHHSFMSKPVYKLVPQRMTLALTTANTTNSWGTKNHPFLKKIQKQKKKKIVKNIHSFFFLFAYAILFLNVYFFSLLLSVPKRYTAVILLDPKNCVPSQYYQIVPYPYRCEGCNVEPLRKCKTYSMPPFASKPICSTCYTTKRRCTGVGYSRRTSLKIRTDNFVAPHHVTACCMHLHWQRYMHGTNCRSTMFCPPY